MSGATLATVEDQEQVADHDLVAAVRAGDDQAFEALYVRYHRRIHAYVQGMVKDHGRAEDVTQEVFLSALRRMRATERPIAFKPWIYEIAKNACIDAFRRSRRAEEVSYDAAGDLAAGDVRRLAGREPDAAVAAKQDLESLCGAFGGLSDTHHQIIVLRELEGLSYREIGERMGMSRPAVESTLFRARRRLAEEYLELVSGARCRRIQAIIATAADGAVGARDATRLARHVAYCQPCRREALASGLDRGMIVRGAERSIRERVAGKIAAWLPLPGFLRVRRSGADEGSAVRGGGSALVAQHLPAVSDQLSAGWAKLAAAAALLLVGAGVGVEAQRSAGGSRPASPPPAAVRAAPATAAPAAARASRRAARTNGARSAAGRGAAGRRNRKRHSGGSSGGGSGGGSTPPTGGSRTAGGGGSSVPAGGSAPKSSGSSGSAKPTAALPASSGDPVQTVQSGAKQATGAVGGAVQQTTGAVQQTTGAVQQQVQGTVQQVQGTVQGTVQQAQGTVQGTVQQTTGAVQGAVDQTSSTVDQATGAVTGALGGPGG